MNNNNNNTNHPKFGTYLGLSIAMTCCCSSIPGVVALIFTILANNEYKSGAVEEADNKFNTAKIALIVGLVTFIILFIIGFIAAFMGALPINN